MIKVVTLKWLRRHEACEDQVAIFTKEWGEKAELTEANLLRAVELHLNIDWLAGHFLTEPLRAELQRQRRLMQAEFERQVAFLRAEYRRQEALLLFSLIQRH